MAESTALKEHFGVKLAGDFAGAIRNIHPEFRSGAFVERLAGELESLELKARMGAIARALRDFLPEDYPAALAVLMETLESGRLANGFSLLALGQFVENYGLDHPGPSLRALYDITKRSSSEFAIRPYILRHPELTLELLRRWTRDPDHHVRRLVSEGTRPRLPWASRLGPFIADPAPVLELLELLKDDPSEYVRRSVANNLNDIGKDHPEILLETARRWSPDATPERKRIIAHALRSLVKQGNQDALGILGFGGNEITLRDLRLSPATMRMNDTLSFSFSLHSHAAAEQRLVVDYLIHFVKASGERSPKVFKMTTRTIDGLGSLALSRRHTIRPITTRRYYSGTHRLEIQVNGTIVGGAEFELKLDR